MVAWSSVPERPLCLKEPRSVQKHQLKAEDTREKDSWLWKEYVLHGSLQTLPENGALVTVTVCRMLHGRTDSKSCFSWYAKLLSANVENILCVAKNGSQSFCWIYRPCPPAACVVGATCIEVAAQNHLAPAFVTILQPHQFRVVFPNGFGILCAIASSQIITGSFLAIPSWDQ